MSSPSSPAESPADRRTADRRWYVVAVLATTIGGLAMFFAASRTWVSATVRAEGLPADAISVTGNQAQPIVSALALVVAAGGLAILSTRGLLRRVVGGLTTAVSVAIGVAVLTGRDAVAVAYVSAVNQSTAFTGENRPALHYTAWPWIIVAVAAMTAVLGVAVVLNARRWPAMGGRFEAPRPAKTQPVDIEDDSGADVWKAIDEGTDPTI